jgi:hypothetical protein
MTTTFGDLAASNARIAYSLSAQQLIAETFLAQGASITNLNMAQTARASNLTLSGSLQGNQAAFSNVTAGISQAELISSRVGSIQIVNANTVTSSNISASGALNASLANLYKIEAGSLQAQSIAVSNLSNIAFTTQNATIAQATTDTLTSLVANIQTVSATTVMTSNLGVSGSVNATAVNAMTLNTPLATLYKIEAGSLQAQSIAVTNLSNIAFTTQNVTIAQTATASNLTVTGSLQATGGYVADLSTGSLRAQTASAGTLAAGTLTAGILQAQTVAASMLNAQSASVNTVLTASTVAASNLNILSTATVTNLSVPGTLQATTATASNLNGWTLKTNLMLSQQAVVASNLTVTGPSRLSCASAAGSFTTTGGPLFVQSPGFDAPQTTHVISVASLGIPYYNTAGTLHFVVKGPPTNLTTTKSPALASGTCLIGYSINAGAPASSATYSVGIPIFMNFKNNVNNTASFKSIAGSTAGWVITTSENCSVAWTFIGAV